MSILNLFILNIGIVKIVTGFIPFTTQGNFIGCLSVEKGNCQLCEQHLFLFTLPQDNDQLQLKAGTRICVQCPYGGYNEANNLYCGDCLDNSQSWDKTRLCTYDYKTKSSDSGSLFHKVDRPANQLFYVVESGVSDYTTVMCDGCSNFCKSKSQTCFPVSQQFQYDLNNLYIQCADGFAFNDAIAGCDSCPENCQSCEINVIRTTDSNGKVTMTTKKICLICNRGFSLLTTRAEIDGTERFSQCIACFSGCAECFYGSKVVNLNQNPWDQYNNINTLLYANSDIAPPDSFFAELFFQYSITQRCSLCSSTSQSSFIPSKNKKECVRCGTNCKSCEYISYTATTNQYPTRNTNTIIEPDSSTAPTSEIEATEAPYVFRCRECESYTQTFTAVGSGCIDCTEIPNCQLCAKVGDSSKGADASFSTLNKDFIPLDKEEFSILQCFLCSDGYDLSSNGLSCTIYGGSVVKLNNCISSQAGNCRKCDVGFRLVKNEGTGIWECLQDCQQKLGDYLCQSCVTNSQGDRCLYCLDGFYVDIETGKCKPCSVNGYCKTCYKFSLSSIHRTEYYNYVNDDDTNVYGPYCSVCTDGDAIVGPFNNEDLRYCEKGGSDCGLFLARGAKGYCDICNYSELESKITRSASLDDADCIDCPQNTIGCRERTDSEIQSSNKFYDPTSTLYQKFSRLAYLCDSIDPTVYLDNNMGRCNKQTTHGYDEETINLVGDCTQYEDDVDGKWKINSQYSSITSKTSTLTLEDKLTQEDRDLKFINYNQQSTRKLTINLVLNYDSNPQNNVCYFQKPTVITTNFRRNVFSLKEIELIITVGNAPAGQKLQWYIQSTIYFEYFTTVSIKGIEILPASDLNILNMYTNIYKYEKPFGFEFLKNDGSKLILQDVKIGNRYAESLYESADYTTPYSDDSQQLKKYKPFYAVLLNTYDIQLINVVFQSQNYLLGSDISYQAKPFGLVYDQNVSLQYFNIKLENVQFFDFAVEDQALFEFLEVSMSTAPEWNSKVFINNVLFKDAYFINDGGFLSTKITDIPTGMIFIDGLQLNNVEYNNSRGIVNFQTMQKVSVRDLSIVDSRVNYTSLFYITTIEMSKISLQNTTFTYFGKLVETQFDISTIRPNDKDFSGLKLSFQDMRLDSVNCLYPACIMLINTIKNDYELPLNITMSNILIQNMNSVGFNETIWEAATSAAIQVQKCYTLMVSNFQSIQNPDLTIFYTDQVQEIHFINLECSQQQGLSIRNNYCVFFNNFYRKVQLINTQLYNLNGIDNSFIGISSWSNLVYNTSSEEFQESIYIENVNAENNTILTTVLAVPSSSILIDSTQEQLVTMKNLMFVNNKHSSASYLKGTLRPSNPTFLIRSVVGTLNLQDSIWKSNSVGGYGAVLYLECGIQVVKNITMQNSNYDPSQLIDGNPLSYSLNELAMGGHLFMAGYNLQLLDSQFLNSSAKVGGAIYVQTLKEGNAYFNNSHIEAAYTPMNGAVVSRGGCMYVDSTYSNLNMIMENMELKGCVARADGGGIYVTASDRAQQFTIRDSTISNCYGLSGTSIKVKFDDRTQEIQKTTLSGLRVTGNYSNSLDYFSNLTNFQIIEEFLYLKRLAAYEQDNGQVEIQNCYSEGLFYYGFISLIHPNLVRLNSIESQHGVLSYRPYIEIIEPLVNSIIIDSVQYRNISSMNVTVNCIKQTTNEQLAICNILQSRIDFPEYVINPAMMLIDQITKNTPLLLKNIFINRVDCQECYGGLVQVMRVSNSELRQIVQMSVCRCSNSKTAYYGCYMVSSQQYSQILTKEDTQIGITYQSKLTLQNIQTQTGLSSRRLRLLSQYYDPSQFNYVITNPSYLAHVLIDSLNIQDVLSTHGGGISVYGLTTNITSAYCTQVVVLGQGGCIYYEAIPKKDKIVYQRINIATSVFFRNNASIGGAIRVKESGINDWSQTGNTMLQNYATLFGNDVAGYPTHLGMLIDGVLQHSSNLNDNTGWLHYPLVIKSGQKMSDFENQTVLLVYLDEKENIMKYQFDAQANLSSNLTNTIQGESLRIFNLDSQGFVYDNLEILFDPYQNITLDLIMNSSLVNIPRYYNYYPYQLLGFDTQYTLQARVRSVECERGEAYNPQQGSCTPCPIGQFVLAYKGICKQIDDTSMKYTFMNKINVKSQYWRPDHLNDQPEKCKNKPINCLGGFDVGNDLCYEGMIGALCEECDIHGVYWDTKYSNSAKYECGTCQDRTRNLIMIVFLSVFTLYSTISAVKANQERMENCILYDIFANLGWASSQKASGNVAVLMKIFNNHTQILSILSGFQIEIPNEAVDSVNTVSMPAKTVGNSLDCFLVEDSWGIDLIYFRIIWSLIMQCIYIAAIMLIMFIGVAIGKMQFKVQYLQTMIIYLFVYLQPNYVMEFMTLVSSRIISGNQYIMANVSYRFDTFKHDQWVSGFGIPGLLAWVLVLPVAFWYACYQGAQQMKLDSFIFSQSWGFFYHEYRRNRYYWEFIKIFYRSLISVLICYFQEEIIVKGILSFLVVYAYYGLSTHFNPYNLRVINDLDQLSTVVLSLSLVVGVFLFRTIEIDFFGLTYAGYAVIALLNAVFLLLFFFNLFKGKLQEFAPMLDDLRDKINEKFPHLQLNPRLRPYLMNQTKLNHKARLLWTQLSKIVNQGIQIWRIDKSKPLQFYRLIETPQSEYNQKINKAHQEFDSQLDQQGLLQGNGSVLMSEEKLPQEGKEQYKYQ